MSVRPGSNIHTYTYILYLISRFMTVGSQRAETEYKKMTKSKTISKYLEKIIGVIKITLMIVPCKVIFSKVFCSDLLHLYL